MLFFVEVNTLAVSVGTVPVSSSSSSSSDGVGSIRVRHYKPVEAVKGEVL